MTESEHDEHYVDKKPDYDGKANGDTSRDKKWEWHVGSILKLVENP